MRLIIVAIALCSALIGCSTASTEQAAPPASEKVQGTQYHLLGGTAARCTTNDGGFTTICRSL